MTLASGPALFRSETVACGRLCCGAIGIERAIIFGLILRSRRRLVAYRSRLKAALSGSQERWRASASGDGGARAAGSLNFVCIHVLCDDPRKYKMRRDGLAVVLGR